MGDLANEHPIPIIYERPRVCHSNSHSTTTVSATAREDDDEDNDEDDDEDGDTCRRYVKPERLLSPRQFYMSNLTCRARRDLPLAKLFGRNYNATSGWRADRRV